MLTLELGLELAGGTSRSDGAETRQWFTMSFLLKPSPEEFLPYDKIPWVPSDKE